MLKYVCKHCGQLLGAFDTAHLTEEKLGLHTLTSSERESIITYESNGDMVIKVVCEYCQEALEKNPELNLISNPLQ